MKRKSLLLLLMLALLSGSAWAQATLRSNLDENDNGIATGRFNELTIVNFDGDEGNRGNRDSELNIGTTTTYATEEAKSLMGDGYYYGSTAQILCPQAIMGGAKTLTGVKFYHNDKSFYTHLRIYLAHKSAGTFSIAFPCTSSSQSSGDYGTYSDVTCVYDHDDVSIGGSSGGWQTFEFDTDFSYNGTSNLVIVVCRTQNSGLGTSYTSYDFLWANTAESTNNVYFMLRHGDDLDEYGDIDNTSNYALVDGVFPSTILTYTTSGGGGSSYITEINNNTEWNSFAQSVRNGLDYSGKTVHLRGNISINSLDNLAGTSSNPFKGSFNGNGNTITLDITTTEGTCAPFHTTQNATFQNLVIDGTINTSSSQAGGLIGIVHNGCSITNCISKVTINSSLEDKGVDGGFIAQVEGGNVTITGCVFAGSLLGSSTKGCGGFVGWSSGHFSPWAQSGDATIVFTDCLFAPISVTMDPSYWNNFAMDSPSATFARGFHGGYDVYNSESNPQQNYCGLTFNNCYYTQAFGTVQGTQAYKVTLGANPAAGGTVDGGTPTTDYGFIKAYSNGLLFNGVYYANGSVSLNATANDGYEFSKWNDNNADNPRTVNVSGDASYTATFTQGGGGGGGDSFTVLEDFETGDFSKLGWTFGGSANWTIVNSEPNAGTYCAKSGSIGHSSNTDLIFTGNFANGTISFYRKVSSESSWDKLHFYIDDSEQAGSPWSGGVAWSEVSYAVTAGTHTLKWSYTKDGSVSSGSDCAWVDDIKLPLAPPTTIASKADWDLFCLAVNSGYDYSGKEVTMTADVSDAVTTMAGVHNSDSDYKAFKGTFNGQNHLLTVNISNGSNLAAAPFPVLIDGTIKNLKVTGTVTQTADKPHAAGLVGFSFSGTNKIENCLVTVNVTNSYTSGNRHIGGIVGHARSSTLTMTGCVYNGTLSSASNKGGLIGWSSAGVLDLDDCFCSMTNSGGGAFHPIGCRDDHQPSGNVDNCYYTYSSSTNPLTDNNSHSVVSGTTGKGKYARTITGDGQNSLTVAHAYTASAYSASGITIYKNGTTTTPGMLYYNTLYAGNSDQVPLTLNCTVPSGQELNGYTASNSGSISGSDNPYTLTMPNNDTEISANITQMKTHIAASESETQMTWDQFAAKVNGGKDYSEVTIYLDEDITVSTMVGTSSNPFRGTFDGTDGNGQQHKITLNLTASENICAPFRYINGATIQNLKVDGTVDGNGKKQLSGLVGIAAGGSSTIYNCLVSATLSTTYSGDSSHGGLVMQQSDGATLTIEGCAFTGTFNFSSSNKFAGFVGWRESGNPSLTFTNCVFAPASVAYANDDANRTFVRCASSYTSNLTFSNCYYTSYIKTTDQGSQAYSVTPVSPVTVVMNGTASPSYNVSGLGFYTNSFTLTNTSTTTIYAKGDATLSLTLSGSSTGNYEADHGTLSASGNNYTLAMQAYDTQISMQCSAPTSLSVNGATATWTGNDPSYIVELGESTTTTVENYEVLNENFDNNGTSLPEGWTSVVGTGNGSWAISDSEGAHSGSYSARCAHSNRLDETYLITPKMDLSNATSATLTFWMKNRNWGSADIEECHVYYRVNEGNWSLLWSTTEENNPFAEKTVTLEGFAANYQIGFKCVDHYGYGLCIDDVVVTKTGPVTTTVWTPVTDNATSPYTFTGLTACEEYTTRVVSQCGQASDEVTFEMPCTYTLTASVSPANSGTISANGTTISGPTTYNHGTSVTLTANAATGYTFQNWTINGNTVSGASTTITMDQDHTVVANFTLNQYTVSVSANPSEGGTVSASPAQDTYHYGDVVEVTTTANSGYTFGGWYENSSLVSPNATYSFTVTGNTTLTAYFGADQTLTTYANPIEGGYVTIAEDQVSTLGAVTVGNGTTGNVTGPYMTETQYSFQESVYTAAELGNTARTITSISYNMTTLGSSASDHIEVYMKNVSRSTFASNSDYEPVTANDKVYDGYLGRPASISGSANDNWITIILDKPFQYNGTDNLMIGIHENTPGNSRRSYLYTTTTSGYTTIACFNNNADLDPTASNTFNYRGKDRANVRLGFGTYHYGQSVTLTAHANHGYQFVNWTENDVEIGTHGNATYTVTIDGNHAIYANFERLPKRFVTAGNWNVDNNWSPTGAPDITDDVFIEAAATIPANCTAEANTVTINGGSITIQDGGQLQHNNTGVTVTAQKEITGYTENNAQTNKGYYLISSPVNNMSISDVTGLQTSHYDLYKFVSNNEANGNLLEWVHVNGSLVRNEGYIYASRTDTRIEITGTVLPSNNTISKTLTYNNGYRFGGWNLIGNPFVCNAYVNVANYYILNHQSGYDEFVTTDNSHAIAPMSGLMVVATATGQSVTYSRTTPSKGSGILNIDVNRTMDRGTTMLDRARVRFGEGEGLQKFQFNPNHTKVYIPQDGSDYAVVYAQGAGTIPVNFKAQDNGRYTLDFSTEDVGFNYLHLIDNMNGNDVDLLQTPYYAFDAKSTDFASRFTLVFATGSSTGSETGNFAFFNNGVWIINNPSTGSGAEATLQVVDMLGRILSSETISGSCSKAINVAPGVYMLRLVNGNDVKVQKIVVR